MTDPFTRTVDLDGTEVRIEASNGVITYCGEEVSRERMQELQDAIHLARVAAELQRGDIKRAAERRNHEEHFGG
jgi:hypothetical protein